MPIPVPNLDDRSFDDLVREALARIPAHTPEWTNPAPGDPGRTLVELFAWMTDTLLYRVNLIPEKQRLAFLSLLGERMRPAVAARTIVALAVDPAGVAAHFIAPLARIEGALPFETRGPVNVLPLAGECYVKRALTPAERREARAKLAQLAKMHGARNPLGYLTTGIFPEGRAVPFDVARATVDRCLYFALLAPELENPDIARLRKAIAPGKDGPCYLSVGVIPVTDAPPFGQEHLAREPVPVSWEASTRDPATGATLWRPLHVDSDSSAGLSTPGVVRLVMPEEGALFAPANNVRANSRAGVGADSPPRVDDPKKDARILGWLRMRPKGTVDSLKLAWAGVNSVEVDSRVTTRLHVIGHGSGQPEQQARVPFEGAIEVESFELEVEESGLGFQRWKRVDDIILAGLQERCFTLDAEARVVAFGDGVRGRIPAEGARIRVKLMRCGGGAAGNVPAGTLTALRSGGAKFKVHQPLAALGGDDGETLKAALRRIPQTFRTRDRAVTVEDYRYLAASVPGVRVGRVEVLSGFRPLTRDEGVPGVISVMTLPDRTSFEPPYPRVDRPFIETITRFLDERRVVGTEIYVTGCEYVPIALSVGIDHAPSDGERVHAAVRDALQKHLFALRPGGPDGNGWPLGGSVRARELEVVVARVEGVTGVHGPLLFTRQRRPGRGDEWSEFKGTGRRGDVELPLKRWQLPELLEVVVGTGGAPASVVPPSPPIAPPAGEGTPGEVIAIPVIPEVC